VADAATHEPTDCELVKPEPATAHSSRREDGREELSGHTNYRTLVCKIFLSPIYPLLLLGYSFGGGRT